MDQIVGHGTRDEISQEIHFSLLKMHIEAVHTNDLEQIITKCCVGDCKYDTLDKLAALGYHWYEIYLISQEVHLSILKLHLQAAHTVWNRFTRSQKRKNLPLHSHHQIVQGLHLNPTTATATNTSNPSSKKREEEDNFRYTSPTLQQEDRQV